MKGMLILDKKYSDDANDTKEFLNSIFKGSIVKLHKNIEYVEEVSNSHCITSSIILEKDNSTAIDYTSKNAKLPCWVEGSIDTEEMIKTNLNITNESFISNLFIKTQSSFSQDLNFRTNFKNNILNTLLGSFNSMLGYLTLNTRSFVVLMNKDRNKPINLILVRTRLITFLYWTTDASDIEKLEKSYGLSFGRRATMPDNSLIVITPMFFLHKWNRWMREDTSVDKRLALTKMLNYVNSLMV